MRILLVSDVYLPRVNGVSSSLATLQSALARAGATTLLMAPEYPQGVPAGETGVLRLPSVRVPFDPEDRAMRPGRLRQAISRLRPGSFDLVHIHTPFLAHGAGVRAARHLGVPAVATYHTLFAEYLHHYVPLLPRSLGRAIASGLARRQCAQLAAVIAPSPAMRDLLRDYGVQTPVEVIPTGLSEDWFQHGNGASFRAAYDIPAERRLLLYVGRIAHEKNLDFLLESFAHLRQRVPGVLLMLAGEGPALPAVRARARQLGILGDVLFPGYFPTRAALRDCYSAADVFVFASRTETQGLVLLEALAQSCPVVALPSLGTESVLQVNCGGLRAPDSITGFADVVRSVLQFPALHERLRAEARPYAKKWSSDAMGAAMLDCYQRACRAAAAARPQRATALPA